MTKELITYLAPQQGSVCIDATFGAGGHTTALLKRIGASGRILACDRDEQAIARGRKTHANAVATGQLLFVHSPFSLLATHPNITPFINNTDAICADLGLSSMQLLDPQRGFSFNSDAPLDMRMSQTQTLTAATIVNSYPQQELADIIYTFGEERRSFRLAKAIVANRPFTTAKQLADLIASCDHRYRTKSSTHHRPGPNARHPATKVFQALRIAVNAELEELTQLLRVCPQLLKRGGRAAFISFHSLEDRIVKHFMRYSASHSHALAPPAHRLPKKAPKTSKQFSSYENFAIERWGQIIKPFPVFPSSEEVYNNRRARSAKLRIIEKTL